MPRDGMDGAGTWLVVTTVWWLGFFSALGLCLGSFLNVVIYRLPLGLAVSRPLWSFCPHCENRIVWYDNLPVLSYLALGGRCRNCWQPISPRYAVVELMTATVVIVLLDRFFIGAGPRSRGLPGDINWHLADDWPIFIAHVILFASLMAMSAIDVQLYWVDIRFTHLAAVCGVVLHATWTPAGGLAWMRPADGPAVISTAVFLGFGAAWCVVQWLGRGPGMPAMQDPPPESGDRNDRSGERGVGRRGPMGGVWLALGVFVLLLLFTGAAELGHDWVPYPIRGSVVLVFLFGVIVYEASHVRRADDEIVETIESEAAGARRQTIGELGVLLPGIVAGAAVAWCFHTMPAVRDLAAEVLHWRPAGGGWQPAWGVAAAIHGYVIAAGLGWVIRVAANLVYGKEAFATGDIHMMAAAGCVAGWQVVVMGFVLACFLAVASWIALLPFKRTRAIPLGPWLWIGFLSAVVFFDQLVQTPVVRGFKSLWTLLRSDNSQNALGSGAAWGL